MTLLASRRSAQFCQSDIRAMTIECDRVRGINLAQGTCDAPPPELLFREAARGMREGFNTYTRFDGIPAIRQAVARKAEEYNGIRADPEQNVIVSAGSTAVFYSACLALFDPGDEIIVFEPYYAYHVNTLVMTQLVPKYVPFRAADWSIDFERLAESVGPKCRGLILNTPNNPTGRVYGEEELRALAAFCAERNLVILTDEIYEYILYDGRRHFSIASDPNVADRTITISGYSKTFSITGWRIGYCIAPTSVSRMIGYVNDVIYVCAPAPLQFGVAEGISQLDSSYYRSMAQEYEAKRNLLCDCLGRAGFAFRRPEGAYYVLADASHLPGEGARDRAMRLLETTGVAAVPGSAFFHGREGDRFLRFCFAKKTDELEEACARLARL